MAARYIERATLIGGSGILLFFIVLYLIKKANYRLKELRSTFNNSLNILNVWIYRFIIISLTF